jgi:hypothetical protein
LSIPGRLASGGGADSMLQFQLDGRGGETKRCQKMKMRQQTRLDSMERKRDIAWRRGNVDRRRGGAVARR